MRGLHLSRKIWKLRSFFVFSRARLWGYRGVLRSLARAQVASERKEYNASLAQLAGESAEAEESLDLNMRMQVKVYAF
jgi:hypothetical protein